MGIYVKIKNQKNNYEEIAEYIHSLQKKHKFIDIIVDNITFDYNKVYNTYENIYGYSIEEYERTDNWDDDPKSYVFSGYFQRSCKYGCYNLFLGIEENVSTRGYRPAKVIENMFQLRNNFKCLKIEPLELTDDDILLL